MDAEKNSSTEPVLGRKPRTTPKGNYRSYHVRYETSTINGMKDAARHLGITISDVFRNAAESYIAYAKSGEYKPSVAQPKTFSTEERERMNVLSHTAVNLNQIAKAMNTAMNDGQELPQETLTALTQLRQYVAASYSTRRPL